MDNPVYVWNDQRRDFILTSPGKVVCHECGASVKDRGISAADGRSFWYDGDVLVCPCGEQFYATNE